MPTNTVSARPPTPFPSEDNTKKNNKRTHFEFGTEVNLQEPIEIINVSEAKSPPLRSALKTGHKRVMKRVRFKDEVI